MKLTALLLASGITCSPLVHGALVSFAQAEYIVPVGQTLSLDVLIAFEQGDSATNLFSFGVRVIPAGGTPFALEGIEVDPDLNFFGSGGAAAFVDPVPGVLGAKGNVTNFQAPHTGSVLATYKMRFTAVGSYTADLDFFNTLGPTEQIFVGGNGSVLDPEVRFSGTTINVIPEPHTVSLLALMALGTTIRRTRRLGESS